MQKWSMYEKKSAIYQEGTINEREAKLYASPKSKIKRDFAFALTIIAPGKIHEIHAHPTNTEVIYVKSGKAIANINGEEFEVKEGDIIGVDCNEPHGFINTEDVNLELMWIYDPAGPADERFLVEED